VNEPRSVEFASGTWGMEIIHDELPPHLSREQHMGRIGRCYPDGSPCRPLLEELRVTRQSPVRVRGVRSECLGDDHSLIHWLSGRYRGRDVELLICTFCRLVQVHDVSVAVLIDTAPDGRSKRLTPVGMERRINAVLGQYTGVRPLGRTYV
jgi:hypothetical protein